MAVSVQASAVSVKRPVGRILVQVVPRARTTSVIGTQGDAIRIRVAAPPVDGAANEELVRFLAQQLGIQRTAVAIAHGLASRRKTIVVEGLTTSQVLNQLTAHRA